MPGGRITVLDCVVTHPKPASYVRGASQEAGFTAALAERFGDGTGYELVPLPVESFGRSRKEEARFLDDLGEVATANACASKAAFVRMVRRELSFTLCPGNACMSNRSLISIAQDVGRGFMPELARVVDEAGDV